MARLRVRPTDPAPRAIRVVVRAYLDDAVEAAKRLSDPSDVEALHDVRVALRHLRVVLKAYASELKPGLHKGLRQAITAVATQTGDARDAEVFVAWLAARARRIPGPGRAAAEWLIQRVSTRRDATYRKLRRFVPRALAMIAPLLRAGIAIPPTRTPEKAGPEPFGAVAARCVSEQIAELAEEMAKVHGPADHDAAHRARIAAKKVRYLLEPIMKRDSRVLQSLRAFQDGFGLFHDLGEVGIEIVRVRRSRPAAGPGAATPQILAGLPAVQASAERERIRLFGQLRRQFLDHPGWLIPARQWLSRQSARGPA